MNLLVKSIGKVLVPTLLAFWLFPTLGLSAVSKPEQSYLRDILTRAVTLCPDSSLPDLSMLGPSSFEEIEVDFDSKQDLTLIRARVLGNQSSIPVRSSVRFELGYRYSPPVDQLAYCKVTP